MNLVLCKGYAWDDVFWKEKGLGKNVLSHANLESRRKTMIMDDN